MFFYIPDLNTQIVSPPASDHFFAMRVSKGMSYQACDLQGHVADISIEYLDKKSRQVHFRINSQTTLENTRKGTLYQAIIDRSYQEKLCEVLALSGFEKLVFVATDLSSPQTPNFSRLDGILVRSCEQCQTPYQPIIEREIISVESTLEANPIVLNCTEKAEINQFIPNQNTCFIGPEGGWSEREQVLFDGNGVTQISYPGIVYPAWIAGLIFSTKQFS